jgi:hypothetical protein
MARYNQVQDPGSEDEIEHQISWSPPDKEASHAVIVAFYQV